MSKPFLALLTVCLLAAGDAHAQFGGGGMGGGGMGGGGGHRGHGNRSQAPPDSSGPAAPAPVRPQTPLSKIEIVGVIKAIDPATDRITIAYEAVDALNWPEGTMPFGVAETSLMKGVSIGEKVRFKLESQQVSAIRPY